MRETVAKRIHQTVLVLVIIFVAVTLRSYWIQIVKSEEFLARGDWRSETKTRFQIEAVSCLLFQSLVGKRATSEHDFSRSSEHCFFLAFREL